MIDSIPVLTDPPDWDQVTPEDIADLTIIKDKDSLKLLGREAMDGVIFIFTKAYRSRPDSLKRIPSLKLMEMKEGKWMWQNVAYSGKYIDYYNNGAKQNEGTLVNGRLNGQLTIYFKNGVVQSVASYKNGILNGIKKEFYKNGALLQENEFANGRLKSGNKTYFINGQIQHELKSGKATPYVSSIAYYSDGSVKKTVLLKNGAAKKSRQDEDMVFYTTQLNNALNNGNIAEANKYFFKLWLLDSTSIESHFLAGLLYSKEHRFDDAIEEFDKALAAEPLMREALVHRGLARLKKFVFQSSGLKNVGLEPILSAGDMELIPVEEQEKICSDFSQADILDFTDMFVKKWVGLSILNYCKAKK